MTERERAREFQEAFFQRIGGGLQLSSLFATLPMIAFLAKDRESRFVCANARTLEIFNLEEEWQILGRSDRDFFPLEISAGFVEEDQRVMSSGETRTYYSQMVPDIGGPLNWYVVSVSPLRDLRGTICGVAIALYDLHEVGGVAQPFQQLEPALRHLHTRFREPMETKELASLSHLSERQFTRVFGKLLGESPMRYLIRQRIRAACQDLITTDRPAGAIGLDCGFYDQSAFTRAFRTQTGLTPLRYRQQHIGRIDEDRKGLTSPRSTASRR
ncbi:MAG: AraC family transcriptional regulator [Verrucomicrobiales bacterium]|nr:AraC family transcriptional regulator [Verrucomicrobiales bacterium]